VPLDVIQNLCGHRDARSTEVYAKLADQALVEAIGRPRMRSGGRSPTAGSLSGRCASGVPPGGNRPRND